MGIRGVLFDKDGTLVDFFKMWVPAYREAGELVVERLGRPDLLDALLRAGGLDPDTSAVTAGSVLASGTNQQVIDMWRTIAGVWGDEIDAAVHTIFNAHAVRAPVATAPLAALFGSLRQRGIVIGVATMDDTAAADATLRILGVRDLVAVVIGADRVEYPKPAPDMIDLFCRLTSLDPSEVAMVGDSPIDLQMGRAAGVAQVIGVLTGPGSTADLAPWADAVLPSIATLEAALRL